eukprot:scaffold63195_cov37-Phaeocystis_antarctica.AAC.1
MELTAQPERQNVSEPHWRFTLSSRRAAVPRPPQTRAPSLPTRAATAAAVRGGAARARARRAAAARRDPARTRRRRGRVARPAACPAAVPVPGRAARGRGGGATRQARRSSQPRLHAMVSCDSSARSTSLGGGTPRNQRLRPGLTAAQPLIGPCAAQRHKPPECVAQPGAWRFHPGEAGAASCGATKAVRFSRPTPTRRRRSGGAGCIARAAATHRRARAARARPPSRRASHPRRNTLGRCARAADGGRRRQS